MSLIGSPEHDYIEETMEESMPNFPEEEIYASLPEQSIEEVKAFYANRADDLSESDLTKLAEQILDNIKKDDESRKAWLDAANDMLPLLGVKASEDGSAPFADANLDNPEQSFSKVVDSTYQRIVLQNHALLCSQILHKDGIADYKISGELSDIEEQKATRRRDKMNNFVLNVDKSFYNEYKKHLLFLLHYGSSFRLVEWDSLVESVADNCIPPADFIVNNQCTSIEKTQRFTHVIRLSKRDIILRQKQGLYRDVNIFKNDSKPTENSISTNINYDNTDLNVYDKNTEEKVFVYYDYLQFGNLLSIGANKDDQEMPLPFKILIHASSKEILGIFVDWEMEDEKFERKTKPVHYQLFTNFGLYGKGLAQIFRSDAIAATNLLRITIDAGVFQNLPACFTDVDWKDQNVVNALAPGECRRVNPAMNTGPLRDRFVNLPFQGPSAALVDTNRELVNRMNGLGSAAEAGVAETKGNTPVGTMLARLEVAHQMQSDMLKSVYDSLTIEMAEMEKIFKDTATQEVSPEDYTENITLIPMSDSSVSSSTHRLLRNEALLQLFEKFPDNFNKEKILKELLEAMRFSPEEMKELLIPPQEPQQTLPLDPITENMALMTGKPVVTAVWQDHQAHLAAHAAISENQQMSVESRQATAAHMQEHLAQQYLVETQMKMGMELPPLEQLQDPAIQNEIALKVASITPEMSQEQPIDPVQLAAEAEMASVQQKEAEQQIKAEMEKMKLAFEEYKIQMEVQIKQAQIESNERIAQLRAHVELQNKVLENEQRIETRGQEQAIHEYGQ